MSTESDPIISNWYQHLDKGQGFHVVAIDEERGLIELQYFDGNLEEIDLDTWYQMDLEPIEPPENWAGALDISETDDFGTSVTDTDMGDWDEPLEEIKGPDLEKLPEEPAEPEDVVG